MKYIFSHDGRPALKRLSTSPVLIALDFDGTLAPIVSQPPQAKMSASTAHELDRLCSVASVAIISGRKRDDLSQRVPADVDYLIGDHGNEGLAALSVDAETCRNICADWVGQLRRMPEFHIDGVDIEPKGCTLAVHFRHATDHPAAQAALSAAFRNLTPSARVLAGKCVYDLIPPGAVCKDEAMITLVKQAQPKAVLYIGDDECDELVFASAQPEWITVRVGYLTRSAAKYYLRYQREVRDLLLLLNLQLGLTASDGT